MLKYTFVFLLISILTGIIGFGVIEIIPTELALGFFFISLSLFILSLAFYKLDFGSTRRKQDKFYDEE